jgi:hypothetical protein
LGSWAGCLGQQSYYVYSTDNLVVDGSYTGLQQRGYFVPQANGSYTIAVSSAVDEIACFWSGPSALSGSSVANALFCQPYGYGGATGIIAVEQGVPIPFRVQWANAQGCAEFDMTVTDNLGNIILSSNSVYSTSVLQYCVNNNGELPPFHPWPLESLGG